MSYKCKDCGKIYETRPNYCDCGNDVFVKTHSNENIDNSEKKEKENPLFIILFLIIVGILVYFILTKIHTVQKQPEINDEYLTSVREEMLKDFDPSGITNSGYCVISFEINEEGWINKRQMVQKSPIPEINEKVFDMLQSATIVPKPPLSYTNTPIKIEFGCIADQREVECYSKNIVNKENLQ